MTDRGSAEKIRDLQQRMAAVDRGTLRAAIEDLVGTFGSKYPDGPARLTRLDDFDHRWAELERGVAAGDPAALSVAEEFVAFARAALLSNPLLDDPASPDGTVRLVVVRRKEDRLGLPQNWEGNASLARTGYDNEIAVLSSLRGVPHREMLYAPDGGRFVGDVDLHFGAERFLFSTPSPQGPWRVYEREIASGKLRELPLIDEADVDNYDACYLPSGEVLFTSTAPFIGVPCVGGAAPVANLYLFDRREKIRRLTFEQDHDWCPTVLDDGRVLYQRWEYADLPHFASRLLFTMNPDGTQQRAFYGSNSYWPNALFYARPIPGYSSKFAAIVGGHHGVPRMGELVLFDQSRRSIRGRWRRAAHSRPRQEVRTDFPRRVGGRQLADVSAPLAAQRQVFPRVDETRTFRAVGRLPCRRVRQSDLAARRTWIRGARADPATSSSEAPGAAEPCRPNEQGSARAYRRHLRGRRTRGHTARGRQEFASRRL